MLDHVSLGVANLSRARKFYDKALKPLGFGMRHAVPGSYGYGPSKAQPWRSGANERTRISFSHEVKIDGKNVPAGTYGLFLALAKDGPWTWVLSKNADGSTDRRWAAI